MYKVELKPVYTPDLLAEELNKQLKDGWELVQIIQVEKTYRYIFKKKS